MQSNWDSNLLWTWDASANTLTVSGRGEVAECSWDLVREKARNKVQSIVVQDSISRIRERALWEFVGIKSATFADSVTAIEGWAFAGCENLASVKLPNFLTEIGCFAFAGCTALDSITIPKSVTVIGRGAFFDCKTTIYTANPELLVAGIHYKADDVRIVQIVEADTHPA